MYWRADRGCGYSVPEGYRWHKEELGLLGDVGGIRGPLGGSGAVRHVLGCQGCIGV